MTTEAERWQASLSAWKLRPEDLNRTEREKALEDAARVAEELPLVGELAPGIADGLSSAAHQIATAIRALIKEPTS